MAGWNVSANRPATPLRLGRSASTMGSAPSTRHGDYAAMREVISDALID
jgi:hypothetical protein